MNENYIHEKQKRVILRIQELNQTIQEHENTYNRFTMQLNSKEAERSTNTQVKR